MKPIVIFLYLLILTHVSEGADTTYYENGNIKSISERYQFRKEFYQNEVLKEEMNYSKWSSIVRNVTYDSLGQVTSKGKTIFHYQRKHGQWKYFENGKMIGKERYNFGLTKNQFKNDQEKKMTCLLTYGLPSRRLNCDQARNEMRIIHVSAAGCVVSKEIRRRVHVHNSFVHLELLIRQGPRWRQKLDRICDE